MRGSRAFAIRLVKRYIPLSLGLLFILFPFFWTLSTAFKSESEVFSNPIKYWSEHATVKNLIDAWNSAGFSTYFRNSLLVAVGGMFCILFLAILVGYALSRFRFRGKKLFMMIILCTQFLPGAMLLIPLFLIFKNVGLASSLLSLIITYTLFEFPFNAILMRGYISNLPVELEEAAWIDGCSRMGGIFRVLVPVLLPSIVAAGAFAFIACWNEYLFALMFINNPANFTVPIGISYLQGQFEVNYGLQAAGALISMLPALLLFAYVQKYLVNGLGAGSVKG